ncbi:endolytic transglycosylase MltG [Hwanghaeella sp.]|uniref:endolytic transglycosylase MltG n=1 Tax=Hwanghaeella sp. TaxID=2605943 RepID=UPI003CCBECE1
MRNLLKVLTLIAIAAVLTAGGVFAWGYRTFHAPAGNLAPVTVIIEPGSSLRAIARQLAENGLVRDARVFAVGARLDPRHTRLTAGEYRFPAQVSALEIIDKLARHDVVQHTVTIPEGLTSSEIVDLLRLQEDLVGDIPAVPAEGAFLPETYQYTRGATRRMILDRMAVGLEDLKTTLWPERAADLPFSTWEEALILASIVEKETGVASERGKVAGVFVNRLRRGMRLQSDPTVSYGITLGKQPLGRLLTRTDLRTPTPYNTYVIPGLPPAPICNPGRDAIAAVLNPTPTTALYFVADGTGGHAFANTLAEHNRNVAKWRRIQKKNQP